VLITLKLNTKGLTMKITTLAKLAKELEVNSLFSRGGTLNSKDIISLAKKYKFRYDLGKYSVESKNKESENKDFIYYIQQKDQHGAYLALWTLDKSNINDDNDLILYNRILDVIKGGVK